MQKTMALWNERQELNRRERTGECLVPDKDGSDVGGESRQIHKRGEQVTSKRGEKIMVYPTDLSLFSMLE